MAYKHIGRNFTPPDVLAKVTGKAKYSEDFRAEGMLFCRLLISPMPHARVRNVDLSDAMKVKGVVAVLRASEVPHFPSPDDPILTDEPHYVGAPILAVAATNETAAAEAISRIRLDLEPLPFTVDPLESLFPRGPNARTDGNVANVKLKLQTVKWQAKDFAAAGDSNLPRGKPAEEWSYGDLEGGFKKADLVVEESFVTAGYAHHSMEPRSAMAYWQNGKCYLHGSSQSQQFMIFGMARYVGVKPQDLVYIAEFCGGGFGSKGTPYPIMAVPAHMSKKTKRPVLMRISREEEYFLGSGRNGFQGWVKLGFRKDGRVLAADLFIVADNGPYTGFWDFRNAGHALQLVYQPEAMRWRGIPVLTNTPGRGPQRGPGENQTSTAIEPIIDKAARKLGIDRVAIRKINAPDNDNGRFGPKHAPISSAYLKEALDKGAAEFKWHEKLRESGKRNGPKVIGVGVGCAYHTGGAHGFDGLVRITPDGKLHIHSGCGNLGTYSYAATPRAAAEALGADWSDVIIERGDTRRGLPFVLGQFGSNSTHTQTRTNWAAGIDAKAKLQEIAAMDLGGKPEDYEVASGKVFATADHSKSMTWAKAAQRAIALGGKYSGKDIPHDLNPLTKGAVAHLAGSGLIGVTKDKLPTKGVVTSMASAFARVEVDTETGAVKILDLVNVVDAGTIVHPQSLHTQIKGGSVMGIGMARFEHYVYDPKLGLAANVSLEQCKPPTYLDLPERMVVDAVNLPDRANPVGAKGVGEPCLGASASAVLSAISDALGGHLFNRTPVLADEIINFAAGRPQAHKPLQVNTQ